MAARLPDPGASRAVLIGVSRCTALDALPAVAGNLSAMEDLFTTSVWGLPGEHCEVPAEPSSAPDVSAAVRRRAAAQARDALLVHYSGHGLIDPGSGELAPGTPWQRPLDGPMAPVPPALPEPGRRGWWRP